MLDIQSIKDGVRHAAQEYPIKNEALFCSYANGTSRPDSDVELLPEFRSPRVSNNISECDFSQKLFAGLCGAVFFHI